MRRRCAIALLVLVTRGAIAQTPPPLLAPLVDAAGHPGSRTAWRLVLLPRQTAPPTIFDVAKVDGEQVLRIEARASYGNLVHALSLPAGSAPLHLAWRWRVERFADGSDLGIKAGDDTALKVCALFDLPLAQLPFVERTLLRFARSLSGEPVPGATVCYVWDRLLPHGTELRNAFTNRLRYIVLRGPQTPPGAWRSERRDLAADFLRVFGDEARAVPPLVAIAIGADADNTKSESRAYLSDLKLER
jgi:Protein of unknown function (DUF3047)